MATSSTSGASPAPSSDTVHRTFLRATAIVAASALLSRVLGFFREWAIAHQVGSNASTDAYYAAFTIPDFFFYLLAGGSLSITFIPVFLEYYASGREEESWRVFSIVLSVMSVVLLILLVVAEVFASHLTHWIAPGFPSEQHRLVTSLTRIILPAQAFFFLGGVLSAVQYAQGRFLLPSLAPLVYNTMIIGFGVLLARQWGIAAFCWGVLAGSFLGNFLIQAYGAARLGARFRFDLNFRHPGFLRYMRLSIPIMLGFSLIFVDDWAIRWFGSYLVAASITWLNYGKILMRVSVAIFAQAAGVASFPLLARQVAEKKFDEMKHGLDGALRHVILAMVPVSVAMAILGRQIVYLLFSHTRLTAHDIDQTSIALIVFLTGAIAWGVQSIIGRGFYALGDTLTPTLIGTGLAVAWLPVYWQFGKHWQFWGLAAASSLGVIIYTGVLAVILYRRLERPLGWMAALLAKTLACAAAAGLIAMAVQSKLDLAIGWRSMKGSLLQSFVVGGVFLAGFVLGSVWTGVTSWNEIRSVFSRRAGKPLRPSSRPSPERG